VHHHRQDLTLFGHHGRHLLIITGGSSGIGLATAELLLEHGASVVVGDLNPPGLTHPSLTYHRTDVTSWTDLSNLFKEAKRTHASIDHVFANAGITGRADYLAEALDEAGNLLEPSFLTYEINLKAVVNTVTLAIHYMRSQPTGGDVVMTGSASSFQPLCSPDYTTAKHGVLGFMRSMKSSLQIAGLPFRINTITPSWTETALFPRELMTAAGGIMQTAASVAPSAALLMADKTRTGQVIYSEDGRLWEIEEALLLPAALAVRIPGTQTLDETLVKAIKIMEGAAARGAA
jgi:NAD(P)-dependent dehydrogenase (short-subunit alcohol dehydrogenase family)